MFLLLLPALLLGEVSLYAPTPLSVAERMLEVAKIEESDIVYDLGSGDGRLVILASLKYKCRSVGIDLDRKLVEKARRNVFNNRVGELVGIKQGDVLEADFNDASVVLVYLMPELLKKLQPRFEALGDGVRIVAYDKALPGISSDEEFKIRVKSELKTIYVYTTPLNKVECRGGT